MQIDPAIQKKSKKLWFVTAISNPARFKRRIELYTQFRSHIVDDLGANLLTVEATFRERGYHAVDNDPSRKTEQCVHPAGNTTIDVRVRNNSWVWLKENLMNIGASHLPNECEYIVFIDADIQFLRKDIVTEIVESLQTYKIVQPFESAVDLGPTGQVIGTHQSFGSCHARGHDWRPTKKVGVNKQGKTVVYMTGPPVPGTGTPWHPGYCLAMRKSTYEKIGGLLEVGALGAGDHHQMAAIIGKAELSYPGAISQTYKDKVLEWQARTMDVVRKSLGYTPGTIVHGWHGSKENRQYISRWQILIEHNFDPSRDIQKNSQGVMEIAHACRAGLRDAIIRYFLQRNEDDVRL